MKYKQFLVPVDFSKHASKALAAALRLAFQLDGRVHILNVIQKGGPEVPAFSKSPDVDQKIVEKDLEDFLAQTCKKEHIDISKAKAIIKYKIKYGLASNQIIEESKHNYDLLIISKRGSSDILDKLFGSVTKAVMDNSHCPVFVLADKSFDWNIDKILYAFNEDALDLHSIKWIIGFAQPFQSQIHFVHISQEQSDKIEMKEKMAKKLLSIENIPIAYEINSIEYGDVADGLMAYAHKNHPRLISLIHKHRGFFESIFHRSTSSEVYNSFKDIPLLILPKEN